MTSAKTVKIGMMFIMLMMFNISQLTYSKEEKPMSTPSSLKLTISSPKTEIIIGDWIQIDLTLTNMTNAEIKVTKPIIDIDSISFLIKNIPLQPKEKEWSFSYSVLAPSVYEHNKNNLEKITLGKTGTPESEFKTKFNIPALALATWQIKADYKGGSEIVSSEPLDFKIVPPKSEKADEIIKDGELTATIETSKGNMTCRFFFNAAPNTVLNFARLAKEGFYNNLIFHRIIKGFMIQGGDPEGTGGGGPGYSIKAEFNHNKHLKGTLSMARSTSNDSAGSQFFICLQPQQRLDHQYTTFGELLEGVDTLDAIGSVKTSGEAGNPQNKPLDNVVIKSISLGFKKK
jgi:cyclophilin family peptidyl-prolyl cis-trans isomerase